MQRGMHFNLVEIDGVRWLDEVGFVPADTLKCINENPLAKALNEYANKATEEFINPSYIKQTSNWSGVLPTIEELNNVRLTIEKRSKDMQEVKKLTQKEKEALQELQEKKNAQKAVQANGLIYKMLDTLKLPYDTKTSDLVKVLIEQPEYLTLPSGLAHPYVGICLFAYFKSEFVFIQHKAIKCVCGKIHKVEKTGNGKKYIKCDALGYKEPVNSFPTAVSKIMLHMVKFLYEALVGHKSKIGGAEVYVTHVDMAEGESQSVETIVELPVSKPSLCTSCEHENNTDICTECSVTTMTDAECRCHITPNCDYCKNFMYSKKGDAHV